MVERKQDALSKNFLLGLIDDESKSEDELHIEVRKAPRVKGDQSLAHLSKRIVDEVRITTPRQRAQSVLKNAGLHTQSNVTQVANSHLQHVGQRARKVALNETPVRRIRRVKKQPEPPQLAVQARTSSSDSISPRRSRKKSKLCVVTNAVILTVNVDKAPQVCISRCEPITTKGEKGESRPTIG